MCIGYLTQGGDRVFAPHPNSSYTYSEGDFVLFFMRANALRRKSMTHLLESDADQTAPPTNPPVEAWGK